MKAGKLLVLSMMLVLLLILAAGIGSSLAAWYEFADPGHETVKDNETGLGVAAIRGPRPALW